MRIAVSGHRDLDLRSEALVRDALLERFRLLPAPPVGVCCLAAGADLVFAAACLEAGGTFELILPCRGYERTFRRTEDAERFRELAARASLLVELPFAAPADEAFWQASLTMLDRSDELLAVWNGEPARGHGGTAEVVGEARRRGLPVTVIWPSGARRR